MKKRAFFDLDKYEIIDKIGEDPNGEIFLISLKKEESQEIFTAKSSKQTFAKISNFEKELSNVSLLDHPSILKIIGASPLNFLKEQNPVIVTDYFPNGSLQKLILSERQGLSLKEINYMKKIIILYGIASGMEYLHSNNILQHILRPENILLDSFLYPKINCFNLSKNLIYHPTCLDITPEGIESSKYCKKSDVYAFAYIAYQLITNQEPFPNMNMYEIMEEIMQGKRPEFTTTDINPSIKDLIERCWSQDPEARPAFDQIAKEIYSIIWSGNDDHFQEFLDYTKYIENKEKPQISPLFLYENTQIGPLFLYENIPIENDQKSEIEMICPKQIFKKLSLKRQEMVEEAEINSNFDQQYHLSLNFFNGTSKFPQNDEVGMAYLQKSIINGSELGATYYVKNHINKGKANEFIKKHLNDDNPLFDYINGFILMNEHNFQGAIQSFEKSANNGCSSAAHKLGEIYQNGVGIGVEKNIANATKFFKMAKQLKKKNVQKKTTDECPKQIYESPEQIYEKGMKSLNSRNINEAIQLFELSASKGLINSTKKLAEIYYYGFQSTKRDINKSVACAKKASKNNDKEMISLLVSIYEKNQEFQSHLHEIYLKAIHVGDIDCMYKYALLMKKKKFNVSLKYFKMAADGGNQFAMHQYVTLNNKIDIDEKVSYLKMASCFGYFKAQSDLKSIKVKYDADNGDTEAMVSYARNLIENKKNEEAIKYLNKASELGNSNAKKELTRIKIKKIKNEIINGDPKALGKLAQILAEHSKYKKNIEEANDYLTKAAQLYDPNIRIELKNYKELKLLQSNDQNALFNHANKIEDDIERSKFWFKRAADLGNVDSMMSYARILDQQVRENLRDFKNHNKPKMTREEYENAKIEEEYYFKKAADLGDVNGMVNYARILDHKVRDYQSALKNHRRTRLTEQEANSLQNESSIYYKKAADLGSKSAMNSYGVYLEYRKKNKNQEEAKKWYKQSADLGYIKGMLNYARVLDQGIRDYRYALRTHKKPKLTKEQFEEDQIEAVKYYKIAAEQGNRNAMYFYALYLEHGNGITPDKEKAVEFYHDAAEKGNTGAMTNYARCLEHGIGIAQDKIEALKWYKRASRYGYKKAEQDYQYLLKSMKEEEKAAANDDDDDVEINIQDEEEDDDDEETNVKRNDVKNDDTTEDEDEDVDQNNPNEGEDDDSDIIEIDDDEDDDVDENDEADNDEDDDVDENDGADNDEDGDVDENEEMKEDDDDDDDDNDNEKKDNENDIDDDFV